MVTHMPGSRERLVRGPATRRTTRTARTRLIRSAQKSPIQSAYARNANSPYLRPFVYLGVAGVVLTGSLSRIFGIEQGLIVIVIGAVAIVLGGVYCRGVGQQARRQDADRREAFMRKLGAGNDDNA